MFHQICSYILNWVRRPAYKRERERGGFRGVGAGPAGTAAAGPMLEAKLMNLIKGRLQKF